MEVEIVLSKKIAVRTAVWCLVAMLYAIHCYYTNYAVGTPQPFLWLVAYSMAFFSLWVGLGPAVEWWTRRTDRAASPSRLIFLHLCVAIGVSTIHCTLFAVLFFTLFGNKQMSSRLLLLRRMFLGGFSLNLLVYSIVAGFTIILIATAKIHNRDRDLLIKDAQIAQAETSALRHQLQPHFLFNTLNSISALTPRRPAAAQTLIARLAELLRMSLEPDRKLS